MMNWIPTTFAAELLDELGHRLRGAAGGQHVVVDDHARAVLERVGLGSSVFVPYSSAYSALIVSSGSFPGRRAGTNRSRACRRSPSR